MFIILVLVYHMINEKTTALFIDTNTFWFCRRIERGELIMLSGYPDILTTDEACEILNISKHSLYKLIHSKELRAKKVARQYRIQKIELLNYLNKD